MDVWNYNCYETLKEKQNIYRQNRIRIEAFTLHNKKSRTRCQNEAVDGERCPHRKQCKKLLYSLHISDWDKSPV